MSSKRRPLLASLLAGLAAAPPAALENLDRAALEKGAALAEVSFLAAPRWGDLG